MLKKIVTGLLLLLQTFGSDAQSSMELVSLTCHPRTASKTLEYLDIPDIRNQLLQGIDSIIRTYYSFPFSIHEKLVIQSDPEDLFYSKLKTGEFPKWLSIDQKEPDPAKLKAWLSLDISELPLMNNPSLRYLDSSVAADLRKKQNICAYQVNAKVMSANSKILMDKSITVILSLTEKAVNLGFYHPEYHLSPGGFVKTMQSAIAALFDRDYDSDVMQVSARPPIINDNFIQHKIRNSIKYYGDKEKGIIKLGMRGSIQYLRYQEPAYQPIVLKGKKQTALSTDLKNALLAEKSEHEYMFLWEESRDILSDRNYKLFTIAAIQHVDEHGKTVLVNNKTGLPLHFLGGTYHVMLSNNDTIAKFSIEEQVKFDDRKKLYHQLIMPYDSSLLVLTKKDRTASQICTHVLSGIIRGHSFKILKNGQYGHDGLQEIFLNNVPVCIAQGSTYPELFVVLDPSIDTILLNQLLLLAFSSLF